MSVCLVLVNKKMGLVKKDNVHIDFNINLLNTDQHLASYKLLKMMYSYS